MQIDWSKAPEWARYVAMDKDGEWYWYENKPEPRSLDWCVDGRYEAVNYWLHSLQERPQ